MYPMKPRPADAPRPSRRDVLKFTALAGAGLVIGVHFGGDPARAAAGDGPNFTPFIRIDADSTVTVFSKHLDKGQGSATGLATLVAEELDATWVQTKVEFAPANAELYKNLLFGIQGTGGSTAIANSFEQYRRAGATARAMLIEAAARRWAVPAGEITIAQGIVRHASGKSARYGELAEAAAWMPVPENVTLKTPDQWVYIGKSFPRVDSYVKTVGAPGSFGMDVQLDDMLVAVLARPPKWGGTVRSVDATEARKVRGVVDVLQIPQGVVVLARAIWPAIKGRDALKIDWDFSNAETRSTALLEAEYKALAQREGITFRSEGDAEAALNGAAQVIEETYVFPYLAHAPMEPIDITILFKDGKATLWTGSQLQTLDQNVTAAVLGIPPQDVAIHTLWAGGSFGRRAIYDAHYAGEAAAIAKAWGRPQPIKLVYTREDDIRGGYYRPLYVHRVRAGVDANGRLTGWHHRVVGQSLMIGTPFEGFAVSEGVDHSSVEGLEDATYAIPDFRGEVHNTAVKVPVLWWRSVGHTHTAYAMETMIDRAAKAAGREPLAFRLELLAGDQRKTAVLKLVAEKANWNAGPPAGRWRGIAVQKSFNSYVAEIAEISRRANGTFKVEKVWCAVDCGVPVNPDNIRAQMEGGIGYGLGAVLRNAITLTDGEVDQDNFDTYEPLRIDEMPDIEVHIVPSSEAPTGVGEPGVPPIGPAVANAIFAATGKMPTELPLTRNGLV
ncbi:MAG: xanthine dehydrogenase family protein molybdopterin-binding subunit [Rhodospirillales bacterium]|nr:MAG: xanthine dehydrogenase family protein molybdopterin-binding subunit [Rhodospirillales bacterium]